MNIFKALIIHTIYSKDRDTVQLVDINVQLLLNMGRAQSEPSSTAAIILLL